MSDYAFTIRNLRRAYGEEFELQIEELFLEKGSICAILGENGAGKTTFLKLLAGLERADTGKILLHDRQVLPGQAGLSVRRRMVYLSQKPLLFRGTVLRNALYGLKVRGISGDTARERALGALEEVGMFDHANRNVHTLSGGEAQRVALARALCLEVDAFLLDEPTAHTDADFNEHLESCLNSLQEQGTTILFSTHDAALVDRLASEKLYLAQGRLLRSLPARPESRVAR